MPENKIKNLSVPLYIQILIAVFLGSLLGIYSGKDSSHFLANDTLGEVGFSVIRFLKILAIPLIFFAIVDTIMKTEITGKNAFKLVSVCLFNVSVAMLIGLFILNVFQPGNHWKGKIFTERKEIQSTEPTLTRNEINSPQSRSTGNTIQGIPVQTQKPEINVIRTLTKLIPESLTEPFLKNNTLSVILIALLFGFAFRSLRNKKDETGKTVDNLESTIELLFQTTLTVIGYIIRLVPFGVFCLVAQAVGKSGLGIFLNLWVFLLTILAGFFIHAFVYYPLVAWIVGKKSPKIYLGRGAEAIITGFSMNSSLATMPLTLKTLTEKMGVSMTSARLSACFGTNLNNDGITLYEAMTALFLTQALGYDLSLQSQAIIILASIFVSMGIAGIPEAGLIILPLVLSTSGLGDEAIALGIALIIPIDWFIARLRSALNVMSDMVVAIILDKI